MTRGAAKPRAESPEPIRSIARTSALLVDLYELTMLQAYRAEGMRGRAVFDLHFRKLPPRRDYLLACGLEDALSWLEGLRFEADELEYLRGTGLFGDDFLDELADFRFTGDVRAIPEGTPVFPYETLLEVSAPIGEAQIAESYLMNQLHVQTVLASKAARLVAAADGRPVVDFGMRRMHGLDASLKGARAYHVAGVAATSNVEAGRTYGVPITGTMAHSYVQAHDDELEAFRAFSRVHPETVLLVDTYDTLEGVRRVVELARERGEDFRVRAIRLDSGDLADLARRSREILDRAGLEDVRIFASGGLDEDAIAALLGSGAPIDGFGVGTSLGVSEDAPSFDCAYKLVEYDGVGRLKLSPGKETLPGPKQVFRVERDGRAVKDLLACADGEHEGRPLLVDVMRGGRRLPAARVPLEEVRRHAAQELERLPERVLSPEPADPPYPVERTPSLEARLREARERIAGGG